MPRRRAALRAPRRWPPPPRPGGGLRPRTRPADGRLRRPRPRRPVHPLALPGLLDRRPRPAPRTAPRATGRGGDTGCHDGDRRAPGTVPAVGERVLRRGAGERRPGARRLPRLGAGRSVGHTRLRRPPAGRRRSRRPVDPAPGDRHGRGGRVDRRRHLVRDQRRRCGGHRPQGGPVVVHGRHPAVEPLGAPAVRRDGGGRVVGRRLRGLLARRRPPLRARPRRRRRRGRREPLRASGLRPSHRRAHRGGGRPRRVPPGERPPGAGPSPGRRALGPCGVGRPGAHAGRGGGGGRIGAGADRPAGRTWATAGWRSTTSTRTRTGTG